MNLEKLKLEKRKNYSENIRGWDDRIKKSRGGGQRLVRTVLNMIFQRETKLVQASTLEGIEVQGPTQIQILRTNRVVVEIG